MNGDGVPASGRALRLLLLLVLLPPAAAVSAGVTAGTFEGLAGWWLRNHAAEAFVIAEPYPRIVAFRLPGGENPLHVSRDHAFFGVRTCFLEPTQLTQSEWPARQTARAEKAGRDGLRLVAAPDSASGLQLVLEVRIHQQQPALTVRHGMRNLRDERRRLALWVLSSIVAEGGMGVTPWRSSGHRRFVFWPGTDPGDRSIHLGRRALAVDYRLEPGNGSLKVGTDTDAGWVAYVHGSRALRSTVPVARGAEYPEGGGTVTMFNSASGVLGDGPRIGEIENVGPLTDLLPGGWLWMEQTLEIVSGLRGDDPEEWVRILELR